MTAADGSLPDIIGPADALGTVRAVDGMLAVRCLLPEATSNDELGWYIFDLGVLTVELDGQQVLASLHGWPIVYQPAKTPAADT